MIMGDGTVLITVETEELSSVTDVMPESGLAMLEQAWKAYANEACAWSVEERCAASPRAQRGSAERSLERTGDKGASQAGWSLSLPSLSQPSCCSTAVEES